MPALHDVIVEFAARRAMQPPAADQASGGYALALGGRHIIHLREIGGEVAAWAWLGDLPAEAGARGATLRRLLRTELARLADDDVVLSLDADALQLHRRVARATLDVAGLTALLQSLVERRRAAARDAERATHRRGRSRRWSSALERRRMVALRARRAGARVDPGGGRARARRQAPSPSSSERPFTYVAVGAQNVRDLLRALRGQAKGWASSIGEAVDAHDERQFPADDGQRACVDEITTTLRSRLVPVRQGVLSTSTRRRERDPERVRATSPTPGQSSCSVRSSSSASSIRVSNGGPTPISASS